MKKLYLSLAIILVIFGLACCKPKESDLKLVDSTHVRSSVKFTPPVIAPDEEVIVSDKSTTTTERKLTKEATISFETNEYKNACIAIRNLITKYHGQINTESNVINENKKLEANFEVRIPSKSFDLFLRELESVDGKIVNKEITIEDITANYLDVERRLKSKKELEARYIQLLAKATKVTEMLEIEKQLNDQRTEIESIEGRFKFMQHEVANNLLHITILETKNVTSGFFGKTLDAFSKGWTIFVGFIIALLTLWPFIIVGCSIWFLSRRYMQRKK